MRCEDVWGYIEPKLCHLQGFLAGDIIDDREGFGDIGQTDESEELVAPKDCCHFTVVGGTDGGTHIVEGEGMGDFDDVTLHDAGYIDVTGVGGEGMHDIFAGDNAEELVALYHGEIGLVRGQYMINDAAGPICG